MGIGTSSPEFAWRPAQGHGDQVSYALQVWEAPDSASSVVSDTTRFVWDSGVVPGDQPFGVMYAGPSLTSGRSYCWRVRTWVRSDEVPTEWSEPASFETGILDPSEWRAAWVSGPAPTSDTENQTLYLRGAMTLDAPVVRARAYVSALGWYRFFVNGKDLTGSSLVPRWTSFDHEVEYQAYDVTEHVRAGQNVLAMAVGDGRFRGTNGLQNRRAIYGDRLAGFVQLTLDLADGTSVLAVSDGTWQAGTGRILSADPKFGERVDLRVSDLDWLTDSVAPARFTRVAVLDQQRTLVAEEVERVQQIDTLPAQSVTRTPSGKQVVDFGQNAAGVVRINLSGPAGSTVRLTHSELLTAEGELDTDYIHLLPINHWYQRDEVILNGEPTVFQPWFTIHGFRYVEIDGLGFDLAPADVEAVVLSSKLEPTGSFDCSDPRLVQLHRNVGWSIRSNFVDVATDCPTRERSGWTGDIQVFAPTATTFLDVQAFLRRWLHTLAVEQFPDGRLPVFIPAELSAFTSRRFSMARFTSTSAGWGDASVLVPWTLYRYYGDRQLLETQYDSMTAWVDQGARRAREKQSLARRMRRGRRHPAEGFLVDTGFHWGEWLRPGENPATSVFDSVLRSRQVVATAYLEHSARVLSGIAELLGRDGDAERFRELADNVRRAWRTTFIRPDGRIGTDRQDDYVRALAFDLLEIDERPAAVQRLVDLIEANDHHLSTGFLSTPMLLPVLVDAGRADVAFRLLLQTSRPAWLYQIEHGATTVWETWEGYKDNGKATGSHNHFAFGTIAGFLTEQLAGLSPAEPGYRALNVRPIIGGGLTHARATLQTPYGHASSGWRIDGDTVTLDVTIPPGTTARVHAGATEQEVSEGDHSFAWTLPVNAGAKAR
jgi:alpha-L-rhamnosidase